MGPGMTSVSTTTKPAPLDAAGAALARSLAISPNLDALLEHDERTRRTRRGSPGGTPVSGAFDGAFPFSLPPPPRGPKKARAGAGGSPQGLVFSPAMAGIADADAEDGGAGANPYINPAPSFEQVAGLAAPGASPPTTGESLQDEEAEGGEDRGKARERGSSQLGNQRNYPSLPRVDKLLTRGRSALGLLGDAPGRAGTTKHAWANSISSSEPLRERKLIGKLIKAARPPSATSDTSDDMHGVLDMNGGVLDTLGDTHGVLDIRSDATRAHPFLSHGSPRSSTSSGPSDSTHAPASTDEPRISISSTIYSQSSRTFVPRTLVPPAPIMLPERIASLKPRNIRSSSASPSRHSFIDFLSPTSPDFPAPEPRRRSPSPHPERPPSRSGKPPIPTAPKPAFKPSSLALSKPRTLPPADAAPAVVPPTTNFLNADERADLIRKSRKLAQVFGQTPAAAALGSHEPAPAPFLAVPPPPGKHQRAAVSVSVSHGIPIRRPHAPWPPSEETQYLTTSGRRHSSPLSPDDFSFFNEPFVAAERSSLDDSPSSRLSVDVGPSLREALRERLPPTDRKGLNSPHTSFIDLSDDDDAVSEVNSSQTPRKARRRRSPSPSRRSVYENMAPEEQAEEERRRKREKLVKLHRFLGSRVPDNLVLGLEDPTASLPPLLSSPIMSPRQDDTEDTRTAWMRRRRSSSAAVFPTHWSDERDRLMEDLNDEEKALNVRRAQKMERLFGVAPPQTLYHTRYSPSSPVPPVLVALQGQTARDKPDGVLPPSFKRSQSAYSKKTKNDRPSTAESAKQLLPKARHSVDYDAPAEPPADEQLRPDPFTVYSHYQHSLNSLNDIIDREDRESLAELHQYLNGDLPEFPLPSPPLADFRADRRLSNAASVKSERRRSLPARPSRVSISSEYSVGSPQPDVSDFQLRRRRAAKLTQFFGVDYTVLIKDVLESIEKGVEEERKRGTLNPDEFEDLKRKLRNLKTKRGKIL